MEERLVPIEGKKGLYYDKETYVVYYVVKSLISNAWCITAMTPFLGKTGRPCWYGPAWKKIMEFPDKQ